jgi:signal transduction histidine kinase
MGLRQNGGPLLNLRRPVLRVQLTLLYSGLFLVLLAVVLFATGTVLKSSESTSAESVRGPIGPTTTHAVTTSGGGDRQVDVAAVLIALAALAVALLLAWWLAGRFLRPLRAMTATAREISATNLNRRLPLEGPDDELTELGGTLNDLFGRLEASFESQRHFVANAAHELRTPLAGQRTVLQVALADPDAGAQSLRSSCEQALQLGAQQERLIDALLALATGERGIERQESFDLGAVARNVVLGLHEEAERRGIRVDTALGEAPAEGDPALVESLVTNLVDNAIRHNIAGGRVEISTAAKEGRSTVSVSNTGALIPAEEVGRLFEPFQRLGEARLRIADGHGFGLAIVRAIAAAHEAEVTALARPDGGLRIEVAFAARGAAAGDPIGGRASPA